MQQANDLSEAARARLSQGAETDDATRLQLLEELYKELEQELDRDIGEISPTRR